MFEIQRALPHGHVAAVVDMIRKLDLPRLLSRTPSRERDLAVALIASRLIAPGSKLSTLRTLAPETATSSLGRVLDLGAIEEREIYAALDWLGEQQAHVERALARYHRGCPRPVARPPLAARMGACEPHWRLRLGRFPQCVGKH